MEVDEFKMTRDELAARGLRIELACLSAKLHNAIDDGADAESLHSILGLWTANHTHEGYTFDSLVDAGTPSRCDDCRVDLMPYDEYVEPVEGAWEMYMVEREVWAAATGDGPEPHYLCIGCLERRIGRALGTDDFMDVPLNDPSWIDTPRLRAVRGDDD